MNPIKLILGFFLLNDNKKEEQKENKTEKINPKERLLQGIESFSKDIEEKTGDKVLAQLTKEKALNEVNDLIEKKDSEIHSRINTIAQEMKKNLEKKRFDEEEAKLQNKLKKAIEEYEPFEKYEYCQAYKADICRQLLLKLKNTNIDYNSKEDKPDIIIKTGKETVAIEIKGPTTKESLASIPHKAMRYPEHIRKIIVILFDLQVEQKFYKEWLTGLKRKFPEVLVMLHKNN